MNRAARMTWTIATARSRGPVEPGQPAVLKLHVLPNDIDAGMHMNNGVYFSMLDAGRTDLAIRTGWGWPLTKARIFPVVMQETMTFRISLRPGQRYELHSAVAGWDKVSVYFEQRFVVDNEIYAQAMVRMRYLKKGRGVDTADVFKIVGIDPPPSHIPAWAEGWGEGTRLPSPKEDGAPWALPMWR